MLKGKHVLLGVTGGIASYKIATLTSLLVKAGAHPCTCRRPDDEYGSIQGFGRRNDRTL